jgi:membrane-associated phospholipid phosphatase
VIGGPALSSRLVLRRRKPSASLRFAVRATAGAALAAAIVVPHVRRRLRVPPAVTVAAVAAGPVALAVLRPRTNRRDVALFALQMWAFGVAHEVPYDDPARLRRRLRINYPIAADRVLGGGELPGVRLQRARRGGVSFADRFLSIVHWAWFFEPYASLLWILTKREAEFPRAARQMAATYDIGCAIYFAVPTAPPWWAAEEGYLRPGPERIAAEVAAEDAPPLRRLMVDVGERTWGRAWPRMYETLGGNPWAAMPSLHFATSLLAALLLSERSRVAGAAGWAYAGTLGFALVYLGEHYVTDLIAGAALVALVRRGEPFVEPLALALSDSIQRLERIANA